MNKIETDGHVWQLFGICPATGKPVYFRYATKSEQAARKAVEELKAKMYEADFDA